MFQMDLSKGFQKVFCLKSCSMEYIYKYPKQYQIEVEMGSLQLNPIESNYCLDLALNSIAADTENIQPIV